MAKHCAALLIIGALHVGAHSKCSNLTTATCNYHLLPCPDHSHCMIDNDHGIFSYQNTCQCGDGWCASHDRASCVPDPASEAKHEPTAEPTTAPASPTSAATPKPTHTLIPQPTTEPTAEPTTALTPEPTAAPTPEPTVRATPAPTEQPKAHSAACSASPACSNLAGDCCPNDENVMLDCCKQATAFLEPTWAKSTVTATPAPEQPRAPPTKKKAHSSACSATPACSNLAGNCCPNNENVLLDCCEKSTAFLEQINYDQAAGEPSAPKFDMVIIGGAAVGSLAMMTFYRWRLTVQAPPGEPLLAKA